jgi:hypothetical protein
MAKHYWTLSKVGGNPAEFRKANTAGGKPVPPEFVQGMESQRDLLASFWLQNVVGDPKRNGLPNDWEVVKISGDDEYALVPSKKQGLDGVFVKPWNELERIPLLTFLEQAKSDSALAPLAEQRLRTIDVMSD